MAENRRRYALAALVVLLLLLSIPTVIYMKDLSILEQIQQGTTGKGVRVYDSKGQLIAQTGEASTPISLEKIPEHTKQAFEATLSLDGDTLIEQITREFLLDSQDPVAQALENAIGNMAVRNQLSEEQRLGLLMNYGDFGEDIRGIVNASLTYFDLPPTQLDLPQSATLAAIVSDPAEFSPYANPEKTTNRRNQILDQMNKLGHISTAKAKEAKEAPLGVVPKNSSTSKQLADRVAAELQSHTEIPPSGVDIITGIDPKLQNAAREIWPEGLEGTLLVVDVESGLIRAYLSEGVSENALEKIQPGSAFDPIFYAAGIVQGFRLNTLVPFAPSPTGSITLKHSLVQNPPGLTQWFVDQLNAEQFEKFAADLRLTKVDSKAAQELSTGQRSMPFWELVRAYLPFANKGNLPEVTMVKEAKEQDTNTTLYRYEVPKRQVMSPEDAYLVTDLLTAEFTKGAAADYSGIAAGKVSNDDRMFIGYTPELLVAVYLVKAPQTPDDPSASIIWQRYMEEVTEDDPASFDKPTDIVEGVEVDIYTGHRATVNCPSREASAFKEGTQPTADCYLHPLQAPQARVTPPPPRPTTPEQPTTPPAEEPPAEEPPEEEPQVPEEPTMPNNGRINNTQEEQNGQVDDGPQ